ncbi:MAG: prepilin-type N-terminal cleavage/methylation domain-containing protein [Candidatus Omnitrophica bacterium]|nr:prepilin-type N-terminal cleavage/methylation domain-containing protein [Candidatus Omnitrophota bacterium]
MGVSERFAAPRGFTLIELLIVIAIILILIAIALPNFLEAQSRARVVRAAADEKSIATAMESYFLDRQTYTDDCLGGDIGCLQLTTPVAYIKDLPLDPFGIHKNGGGNWEGVGSELRPFYPMGTGINPKTEAKCCNPYPAGSNRNSPPFRECYIIYSSGPFDQEPGGSTGPFPVDGGRWTIYSPTNGAKSYGGIITTGGTTLEHRDLWSLRATHI